jgi:hypothetical protein
MPLVTIYLSKENVDSIKNMLPSLREFIARELACGDRAIDPGEVSINVVLPLVRFPIAEIEVIISAYSYKPRVERQDEICLNIKNFISSKTEFSSVFVWLGLSELGHSVKE